MIASPYRHAVTWRTRSSDEERTTIYFSARHHTDRDEVAEMNAEHAVGKDDYDAACAIGAAVVVSTSREIHDGA
jgi:hypothetical protein